MRKNLLRFPLFVISFLYIVSYKNINPGTYEFGGKSKEQVIDLLISNNNKIKNLYLEGYLFFSSPYKESNGRFSITYQAEPLFIQFKLKDTISTENFMEVYHTSDTLIFFDVSKQRIYATGKRDLTTSTYFTDFPFQWLYSSLWGKLDIKADSLIDSNILEGDGNGILLSYAKYNRTLQLGNAKEVVVTSHQLLDSLFVPLADFSYPRLVKVDDVIFPQSVSLFDIQTSSSIEIIYTNIEINRDGYIEPKIPDYLNQIIDIRKIYR